MSHTCSVCACWNVLRSGLGECRRYPPRATPRNLPLGDEVAWVVTGSHDWCGECTALEKNSIPAEPPSPQMRLGNSPETLPCKKLLSEKEAAEYLGVSRQYLRKSRVNGDRGEHGGMPPYVRIGRLIRYDIDAVDAWINGHART